MRSSTQVISTNRSSTIVSNGVEYLSTIFPYTLHYHKSPDFDPTLPIKTQVRGKPAVDTGVYSGKFSRYKKRVLGHFAHVF